jgi:hypothetical protein
MFRIERMHIKLVVLIAGIFLPLLNGVARPNECTVKPIKPIRCVCGLVDAVDGEPVSDARVTVLKDKAELVSERTGTDGRFSFESLERGL